MARTRTRLNLDWDSLFPGNTLTIGNFVVVIRPLGLLSLATIAKELKGFGKLIADDGVTWETYHTPENLIKIAAILLDKFPGVLAEASNIAEEDLVQLPLETILTILNTVLEVNMKSKEDLEKNFQSLAEKFQSLTPSQK